MSSSSILGPQEQSSRIFTQHTAFAHPKPVLLASTPSLLPQKLPATPEKPDNFSSLMKDVKPFIPKSKRDAQNKENEFKEIRKPHFQSYSTQNLPVAKPLGLQNISTPSESQQKQQSNLTSYVFPQTYTPIYIPIIVQPASQPQKTTSSYNFTPNSTSEILTGRIKFFDEVQNYGFFTLDLTGTDLFVHYDDLLKSGITKDFIQMAKAMGTRFAFRCISYYGKYNLSYKAVDIRVLQDNEQIPNTTNPNEFNIKTK